MLVYRVSLILMVLFLWQTPVFAVDNGTLFPDVTFQERVSGENATFYEMRQNDMAIVYIDFFNAGKPVDLDILAKISGRAIFSDRPDGQKIKVFAIGAINSYPDEDRFPVFIDDAFSAPDLLGISLYPYVLTVDCQGAVIGQMHFEPPSMPGDPIQTKGLVEEGKWRFIQESVQRAVSSGACK